MRILPPSDQEEQFNIYEFEDYIPEITDETTGEAFPSTSYRLRWNERTESWECDWFDEDGVATDQGRRLSANWWIRTPWLNDSDPDPMPAWLAFVNVGETNAESDYEGLGTTHKLIEYNREEIEAYQSSVTGIADKVGAVVTVP